MEVGSKKQIVHKAEMLIERNGDMRVILLETYKNIRRIDVEQVDKVINAAAETLDRLLGNVTYPDELPEVTKLTEAFAALVRARASLHAD